MIKRINLISGPRNISTALMYAFDNRSDVTVVDEPMYAYYLDRSGVNHPGKEAILSSLPTKLETVLKEHIFCQVDTPIYFIKGMAHHYYNTDLAFLRKLNNVFLIRDPEQLITSFSKVIKKPGMQDIGLEKEWEIFQYLKLHQEQPIVLDSGEVLKDPEKVLEILCQKLDIKFCQSMLSWKPGPRIIDGVWAPYWYSSVHRSDSFSKNVTAISPFPTHLSPLLNQAKPYYNRLFNFAIKA